MPTRLFWRRTATAAGIYAAAVLGFAATVVAARSLGVDGFGLFAIVMAAAGLFQTLLDLTVEEALTKYGFHYAAAEDWGRLRRVFSRAALLKTAGGVLAAAALLVLAPFADAVFDADGLALPLALAALLPVVQAPEGLAATALILRGRYDLRAAFLALSMAIRLAAVAVGAQFGVAETIGALVAGQAVATAAVGAAGLAAFRRFPEAPATPLGADARAVRRFVLQSSAATGVVSLRTALAPLLLGVVASPAQVAFFRTALAPQQALLSLSAPARMILLTDQTRDWERGRRDRVFAGVRRYSVGAAAVTAVVVGPLLVFMDELIELLFGAGFAAAADAARIVLVAAVIQFVYGWTKSFPVTIGAPNLRVWTHGLETLVLVPLTIVLGAELGAEGAAWALLAATAVFSAHWTVLFLRVRRGRPALGAGRQAVAP